MIVSTKLTIITVKFLLVLFQILIIYDYLEWTPYVVLSTDALMDRHLSLSSAPFLKLNLNSISRVM